MLVLVLALLNLVFSPASFALSVRISVPLSLFHRITTGRPVISLCIGTGPLISCVSVPPCQLWDTSPSSSPNITGLWRQGSALPFWQGDASPLISFVSVPPYLHQDATFLQFYFSPSPLTYRYPPRCQPPPLTFLSPLPLYWSDASSFVFMALAPHWQQDASPSGPFFLSPSPSLLLWIKLND